MMDPSVPIQKARLYLQGLATLQEKTPDKKVIYRKDGSVVEADHATFRQRNFGTTSLADFAKRITKIYTNASFINYHQSFVQDTHKVQKKAIPGNFESDLDIRLDFSSFKKGAENLESDLKAILSLKDRVTSEIARIDTAIKAWGIFRFLIGIVYISALKELQEAEKATNNAISAIQLQEHTMKIHFPAEPVKIDQIHDISQLIHNTGLKGKEAAIPLDGKHGRGANVNNVVKKVDIEFEHFLFSAKSGRLTNQPLVLFNQEKRVRSLSELEAETRKEISARFTDTNVQISEEETKAIQNKVQGYITAEISNFNAKVLLFLKEKYADKFFLLEEEVKNRAKDTTKDAISSDELVQYCERLNAMYIVTYTHPNTVDKVVGAVAAPLTVVLDAIVGQEEEPEELVYLEALIASGLDKTLFKADLEDFDAFLKECTTRDGLIALHGQSPFPLVVLEGGSIPTSMLEKLVIAYIDARGECSVRFADPSPQGIGRAFVDAFPDRKRAARPVTQEEAIILLENLGYKEPSIVDSLRLKMAKFIANDPTLTLVYYASLEGIDEKDTQRRHAKFNLVLFNFLRANAREQNKQSLEQEITDLFASKNIEQAPCSVEEFIQLVNIARKKPKPASAPTSPLPQNTERGFSLSPTKIFKAFENFLAKMEQEYDPLSRSTEK